MTSRVRSSIYYNDSIISMSTEDILPAEYLCYTCSERLSRDKIVKCQGKLLLVACIETKSRILNGRLLGGSILHTVF